ncbi:acid phosphatase [Rickenella mellea]|uniref:Acid phosphatase n=1 Tax=Rickenella mellea TaxID=50990 RepID=A0A4R5XDW6_9AGAM|nr:acid phosphatase [Rickenella mellea]
MRFSNLHTIAAATLLSLAGASAQTKLLVSNDDGWAVANIRAFFNALDAAGFPLVMSAPADNESGTGSSDSPAKTVGSGGCEFSSCPAGAPAEGFNSTDRRLNYVNSFPVTSVKFGIQTLAPKFFSGANPDLVVAGPNVGNNLGSTVLVSGTVGAATEAAKEGIPSIAFSGKSGSQVSYTTLSKLSTSTTAANVYAALSVKLTQALLAQPFNASSPILPAGISLNVNYPSSTGSCTTASAFKFVLTRINSASSSTPPDVNTCGTTRLPTESSIVARSGCLSSVSVMNASNKGDVSAATQQFVLQRLGSILSCA